MESYIKRAATVVPSNRQMILQEMEMYGFIHFSVNTFTDREWGDGKESPSIFNPTQLDANQWVRVCKSAGMKGLILTCKHHDGFCLWPSRYTEHSVKNSPWKNGSGDVVKEVSEACAQGEIKFGVYLSPWDRHENTYGDSPKYNEFYKNQLTELLTNYGEIFCVWLDGACGEGVNGREQQYDWEGYYNIIRKLQPNAVISSCGPDIRWCGNESGNCRESEWSVVPFYASNVQSIQEKSQKEDTAEFAKQINVMDADLGSREKIKNADRLIWYPSEVDVSIRPGWFYHKSEDNQLKTLDELMDIYYGSVGGNSSLLLNIPPDKKGLIHENDSVRMEEFGDEIRRIFSNNIAAGATVAASDTMGELYDAGNIVDGSKDTYWCPCENTKAPSVVLDLREVKEFDIIAIGEHIKCGQRIEKFHLEYKVGSVWKEFYKGTVIGYKRICRFENIKTRYLRLVVKQSRWYPTISYLTIHKS